MTRDSQDSKNKSLLDRRTYLRGVGVATAVVGGMGGITAAQGDDYDVIEVPSGQSWTYNMDDGETLENLLIDITAPGANWEIRMHGDDMTVRNVGIRGNVDSPEKMNHISVAGSSSTSNSVIENVYYEGYTLNGFNNAVGTGGTATPIFVSPNHGGDLLIRNVNLQSCPDNLIYASAPGNGSEHPAPGAGGTVRVEDSYLFRTGAGCVRLGTNGSYAENCILDGDHSNTAAPNSRPFWGYYEHTELRDCDVMNGSPGAIVAGASAWRKGRSAEVTAENTYFEDTGTHAGGAQIYGSSADRQPRTDPSEIDGVPLSPEEAASGSSSGSASPPDQPESDDGDEEPTIEDVWNDDEPNHVELTGGSADEIAEYRLIGHGDAEAGDEANTNPDDPYRDTATTDGDEFVVEGYLGGHVDDFYIEGAVIDVETTVELTATVNGYEFDVEELEGVGSWDGDDERSIEDVWNDDEPNHVELTGGSADEIAEYEIAGFGDAETGDNADTNSDDPYRDTATTDGDEFVVEGYLGGHVDDFYIEGAVTDVETTVELTATVNGHEFDVEELEGVGSWDDEDEQSLPHALVIDGAEAAGTTDYSFAVSGDLVQSEYDDATIDAGDEVDGQTAEGTVDDGRDAYWFSGDITDFWLAGEADVTLEYDARDE